MEVYRLVLMDRNPPSARREYRVCLVKLAPSGAVESWEPETTVAGGTQEEAHAALMAMAGLAEGEEHEEILAMAGAFYLPVLRETELPTGDE